MARPKHRHEGALDVMIIVEVGFVIVPGVASSALLRDGEHDDGGCWSPSTLFIDYRQSYYKMAL